jgi:hypothetical protein
MRRDIAHLANRIIIMRQRNSTATPVCIPINKFIFIIEHIMRRLHNWRQRSSTATLVCFPIFEFIFIDVVIVGTSYGNGGKRAA